MLNLYNVTTLDEPYFVVAKSWQDAVDKLLAHINAEGLPDDEKWDESYITGVVLVSEQGDNLVFPGEYLTVVA